jgi:hypothetical protein
MTNKLMYNGSNNPNYNASSINVILIRNLMNNYINYMNKLLIKLKKQICVMFVLVKII